ncbi:MAG: family major facilitator superfamily protein [Betaproteobacteria bacterium]|nr:family major facilitator superfamily protein [Betaproteobacteria bacterium]
MAGTIVSAGASRVAWAQAYPTRPVRILVGFTPGGSNDVYARLIAKWLSERLGGQFIVDNRPGAGGNIATEAVARSSPDGLTLLVNNSSDTWNATLYDNLRFNFIRDLAPVATIARGSCILVVNPKLPVRSVPELIAYAKKNPGKIAVASGGIGSFPHMFFELFKSMASVDMQHVPYKGGSQAVVDLLAGQVQAYFSPQNLVIQHIKTGALRALAVTGAKRAQALPDVPTVGEFLPGYEASSWWGVEAPKNTPPEIIGKLSKEIAAALADPGIRSQIAAVGDEPFASSPHDFGKLIAEDTEKWAKVVRAANLKATD